jgi:hypothetical protein
MQANNTSAEMNSAVLSAFVMTMLLSGCAAPPHDRCNGVRPQCQEFTRERGEPGQPLSKADALEIAKRDLLRRGISLTDYQVAYSSYQNRCWSFTFDSIDPGPKAFGSDLSISVDERTDTTFYSPGR